jgi:hypothetical protein
MEAKRRKYLKFIDGKDFNFDLDLDSQVLEKFGPPPYPYLKEGDPIPERSLFRKQRNITPEEEKYKHPAPNYRQFKRPEYVDSLGRQYSISDGALRKLYIKSKYIKNPEYMKPTNETKRVNYGPQVLHVRIPIYLRKKDEIVDNPELGENIILVHIDTQMLCTCEVEEVYFQGKRKTGYLLAKNFIVTGNREPGKDDSF